MKRQTVFKVTKADCRRDTFCAGGKGGQHQNATKSAVRYVHAPSGAVGESRESRHQHINDRLAWERLGNHPLFVAWAKIEVAKRLYQGPSVDDLVEEAMRSEHLKVEILNDDGRWVEYRELA